MAAKVKRLVVPTPPPVTIKFKVLQPVEIEIDPDKLTFDDWMTVSTAKDLTEAEGAKIFKELLSRLTGQEVGKMPARVVNALIAQLGQIANGDAVKN